MDTAGVMTLEQLAAAGVPPSTVRGRTQRGEYVRLLPRVYATTGVSTPVRCRAVTLWQSTAVLSHRTAGWMWRMHDEPSVIEATVARTVSVRTPQWLTLYRRALNPADVTTLHGMPTVALERAALDMMAVVPTTELDTLVDASILRRVNPDTLEQWVGRSAGRWGVREARDQLRLAAPFAESEPERLFDRALRRRRCPMQSNARLGPYRPDLLHRRARLIVEIDGREFHSSPQAFVRDRERQNALQLDGWLVLRYAARTVLADVDSCADEVVAVVRRRS